MTGFQRAQTATIFVGIFSLVSAALLPQANGELVLEEAPAVIARGMAPAQAASSGPANLNQVVSATISMPVEAPTGVSNLEAPETAGQAELIRRKRMREELKNEDLLQTRMEELRLKDEQKRTQQIMGSLVNNAEGVGLGEQSQEAAQPVEVVEVGQDGTQTDVLVENSASAARGSSAFDGSPTDKKARFVLSPRVGIANMSDSSGFEVDSKLAVGISAGLETADNITFEIAWSYNKYGVDTIGSYWDRFGGGYNNPYGNGDSAGGEVIVMNQNVFEAGLKFHVMSKQSRLRPFVSGGGGWAKSFINFNQKIIDYVQNTNQRHLAQDYELNQWLGYLGTGLDVSLTRALSATILFKYYNVFSSNESYDLSSFYNQAYRPYYSGGGYTPYDNEKEMVGASFADSSFYSVTAGVNFTF